MFCPTKLSRLFFYTWHFATKRRSKRNSKKGEKGSARGSMISHLISSRVFRSQKKKHTHMPLLLPCPWVENFSYFVFSFFFNRLDYIKLNESQHGRLLAIFFFFFFFFLLFCFDICTEGANWNSLGTPTWILTTSLMHNHVVHTTNEPVKRSDETTFPFYSLLFLFVARINYLWKRNKLSFLRDICLLQLVK